MAQAWIVISGIGSREDGHETIMRSEENIEAVHAVLENNHIVM